MEPMNHCAESDLGADKKQIVEEDAIREEFADEQTVEKKMSPNEEVASEIESRSRFYRMLSKFFYWPYSQEELDSIDAEDLKALSESVLDPLMSQGYNDMYRSLRRRTTGTREILNSDFTRCFMGTTTFRGIACVPYASVFLNPGGELMGKARNEIRRVYRANRIELEGGIDLPEDHLSFEFEFMAILGERCAQALREGRLNEAENAIDLQVDFLEKYILSWSDRMFDLSVELVRTRFYRGVIKVTKGFLSDELDSLAFLASEIEGLRE